MTQLSLSVSKDAQIVRQGLQDLAAEIPKVGRLQIYRTELEIVRRMKMYYTDNIPPQLPSYTRSGDLAMGYVLSPTTNGYRITNNVPYTKYVVGNAYGLEQAWMHARPGRHTLFRDVQEEEVAKLAPEVEQQLTMVARRIET
jgi:hypothetical protein